MALDKHSILFDVRRSIRYHDRRLDFFERMHQVTSVLTILLSGSILLQIAGARYDPPLWLVLISLAAAILAAIDMVVGYAKMANTHRTLKQKFCLLEIEVLAAKNKTELSGCESKKIKIEVDEPPVYRALDLLCRNEVMVAEGYDQNDPEYVEVGIIKRLTSHIWPWPNIGYDAKKAKGNKIKPLKIMAIVAVLLVAGGFVRSQYLSYTAYQESQATQNDSQKAVANESDNSKLSDSLAKDYAIKMVLVIDQAKKDFAVSLDKKDSNLYMAKVNDELLNHLNKWPESNLKNNAIFPYYECRQAAENYRNYTLSFFNGKVSNEQKKYYYKHFNESYSGCQSSIKNPDMTLKNIE